MLGKTYSIASTFETKNVKLAKEKKISFDVSRSSGKNSGKWKKSQKFPCPDGQGHI